MSDAHELIRKTLKGEAASEGIHWQRLMSAVNKISAGEAAKSVESEAVLRALLDFHGHIELAEGSELPHAMPPEEMLKAHAVQALARADLEKHRDAIQRVADDPQSSDRLAGIARMSLTL